LGFRCSRVRRVLGRISSIPPDLTSFGGINLVYGLLMRCYYYPQSLVQVRGAIRGLTGAYHWLDLPPVNCWTRVSLGRGVAALFLICLELFW
jgi:hypothetical protein